MLTWVPQTNSSFVERILTPASRATAWYGYRTERFFKVIAQASAETDSGRKLGLYQQADQIVLEELPILPLYFIPPTIDAKCLTVWPGCFPFLASAVVNHSCRMGIRTITGIDTIRFGFCTVC